MRINFALSVAIFATAIPFWAKAQPIAFSDLQQGTGWTHEMRKEFYSTDQGSRMIPLAWIRALAQQNGHPFLEDGLSRYGYLPNPDSTYGLPVGFVASGPIGTEIVGMTCAACHTRQITIETRAYRVDGCPALVDFQRFLRDLDLAVGGILGAGDAAFASFAAKILNSQTPDADDIVSLRRDMEAWYLRFHTLIARALPDRPWGLGRLDAVAMIFNRVTGLDIGPPPTYIIADNIRKADAPVRYPFLWNASKQDRTQWPGFAANGSDVLALGRNLGEVFGVFGVYEPKSDVLITDYLSNNSANFDGLERLESLIKIIGPPKWPWVIDAALAAEGKSIFDRATKDGGCKGCHDAGPGQTRFPLQKTWKTPITDAHTDTRELGLLDWRVKTGALRGAYIPFVIPSPLGETDKAINVLAISVVGSIAAHTLLGGQYADIPSLQIPRSSEGVSPPPVNTHLPRELQDLESAFQFSPAANFIQLPVSGERLSPVMNPLKLALYESRVIKGIWAVAPYLHNGSVPTLAELLKPADQRVSSFAVGPAYDIVNVGIAVTQTSSIAAERVTTDCNQSDSGDSRCGHEFGTWLTPKEKRALLEYLKTL